MTSEGSDILAADGDGFKPIPKFTDEQIAECTKNEDFMPHAHDSKKLAPTLTSRGLKLG